MVLGLNDFKHLWCEACNGTTHLLRLLKLAARRSGSGMVEDAVAKFLLPKNGCAVPEEKDSCSTVREHLGGPSDRLLRTRRVADDVVSLRYGQERDNCLFR